METRDVVPAATLINVPSEVLGNHLSPYLSLREMYMLARVNRTFYENLSCQIYLYWQSLKINENPSALTALTHQDLARMIESSEQWHSALTHPEKLFNLCLELNPANMLKLAKAFSACRIEICNPLKTLAEGLQQAKRRVQTSEILPVVERNSLATDFYSAFICYALFTNDIKKLDQADLNSTLAWLEESHPHYTHFKHALTIIQKAQQQTLASRDFLPINGYLNLSGAGLYNIHLEDVSIPYIRLMDANLTSGKLLRCNLQYGDLERIRMVSCNLSGSDLSGASLKDGFLPWVKFADANVLDIDFRGAHFIHPDVTPSQVAKVVVKLLNHLDQLLFRYPGFTELHEAVKNDISRFINSITSPLIKQERLTLFRQQPLFIQHPPLLELTNSIVVFGAQSENELAETLTDLYKEHHWSPMFAEVRRNMALSLVDALNNVERARREQLLKAAYHHPFFSEHRHLPSVREIFNKAFQGMRWYALNCFGLYGNRPLHRNLIETNSQKLLGRELMVSRG